MTRVTWFAVGATILWAALLCLTTVVQILYMESLRLRSRDLPALQFFKEKLEERIGVTGDAGVLAFSLIKHTLILLLGVFFLATRESEAAPWQNLFEAALFAWLTMLLTTYVFAQVLYRKTRGHWLLPLAPILRVCALLVRPLTAVLGFFQSLVELSEPAAAHEESASPGADIEALISAGEEEGLIEKDDRKLIESVVAFGDKTVREVMTPRPKIVAIDANRSLEDLRELVIHEQYSRIPVYEDTASTISSASCMCAICSSSMKPIARAAASKSSTRPIRLVPETKPVNDLLREMQPTARTWPS